LESENYDGDVKMFEAIEKNYKKKRQELTELQKSADITIHRLDLEKIDERTNEESSQRQTNIDL